MRNKFILWLSLLIAFLSILYSCRNEYFAGKDTNNPCRNNADFFIHKKTSVAAKGGIDRVMAFFV